MSRAAKRWWAIGGLMLVAIAAIGVASLPYVPGIHGSSADEIERLAEWLELRPGMRIADIGAGDGTFALALARRVRANGGHVFATELDAQRVTEIREAVAAAGLDNVTVITGAVSSTNLPEECCDAVFSRNVYHHITDPQAINADIRRVLRPRGRSLIIDFEPGSPLDWVGRPETAERHGGHGTPRATVVQEVTAAGFDVVRGPEQWRGRLYAVLFEKRADAAPRIRLGGDEPQRTGSGEEGR